VLDNKTGRIRIYKYAIHSIGNPKYIVLIVSPHNQSITIMRSEKSDPRAYYFKRTLFDNNRSPEIFSRPLVRSLFDMNECWDKSQSYRVYGETSPDGSAVTFNFTNCELFLGEQEWQ